MIRLALYVIIAAALVGVGYVAGYRTHSVVSVIDQNAGSETASTSTGTHAESPSGATTASGTTEKIVEVSLTKLTPGQRDVLAKVGISGDTLRVTPQMMACAQNALSTERITEIVDGATPTALEIVKLAPCVK